MSEPNEFDLLTDELELAESDLLGVGIGDLDEDDASRPDIPEILNLLPLRDSVVYPMLIAPLSVSRESSMRLIDDSVLSTNRIVGMIAQRKSQTDQPGFEDVFEYGCAAIIRTLVKMPDSVRLIVQGIQRFKIVERIQEEPYLQARIELIDEEAVPEEFQEEVEALRRSVAGLFEQAVRLSPNMPEELRSLTSAVQETSSMADLVAAHMTLPLADKQVVLETLDLRTRLRKLVEMISREVRVLELASKVNSEVSQELTKSQREYYLREQLRAIQRELGEVDDRYEDLQELKDRIEAAGMHADALREVNREFERLRRMNPGSPEYTVARTYVDVMVSLPWSKNTQDNLDLSQARTILDEDHFGLDKIKDRIIEFLAVRKLKGDEAVRQPILCFVGPPGVGKTSLGRSIAHAMDRKFVRISLGGMRDEAEIRGHRRTYIGALPGQIMQGIRRCESNNPVFILDEIDKLGSDFRGDPSSALLEVLDPEQNSSFRDHYIESTFDLSRVFFITTANRLDTIPGPLRDRMEVIELGGYTEEEKLEIAVRHLIEKQVSEHGIKLSKLLITREATLAIIRGYTREAGVRNMEREIAGVIRKAALKFAEGRTAKLTITPKFVEEALGAPRFSRDEITERELRPGMAVGLAWTPVGGDILFIETLRMPGKRGLILTGQLGDVMKESVTAAMSYVRSNAAKLKINLKDVDESEVHVHLPAAAVPKDGPSAGVTMVTALTGLFTNQTIRERLAMTGEVTLTGSVLPVGGIKEKVLAAHRAGVDTVVIPEDNKKDYLEDVPEPIRAKLKAVFVKDVSQVLRIAFRK